MYLPQSEWSTPEEGDPPPCFRQGDLVQIDWIRLDYADATTEQTGTKFTVELRRREVVVLVSTCCDLVLHKKPKRKGFLVSPLKRVPKHLNKPDALAALKAPMPLSNEVQGVFSNLIYFAEVSASSTGLYVPEGVIYLEALAMVDAITLEGATKLAELTRESRVDFKERLKWHVSRGVA